MLNISVICVGKLKEKFYTEASAEYCKRLSAYCRIIVTELPEARRPKNPSAADTEAALLKEAAMIENEIPKSAAVIALCIEGRLFDSAEMAALLEDKAGRGVSRVCFVIGGSDGLHPRIKALADTRLSMSRMTFPHHLARIMLLEQLYRGFKINEGGKYHK